MPPFSVIPAFDVFKYSQPSLLSGSELPVVDQLGFDRFDKVELQQFTGGFLLGS
jgi:hypothetical protein